jgi:hypothetical protein
MFKSIILIFCLMALLCLESCSSSAFSPKYDSVSPPSQSEMNALAQQDSVKYEHKENCLKTYDWPVTFPVQTTLENAISDKIVFDTLYGIGLVSRQTKQLEQHQSTINDSKGEVYLETVDVYQLTDLAKPLIRNYPDSQGKEQPTLCFSPSSYSGESRQYFTSEDTGYDYIFGGNTYKSHLTSETEDGKQARSLVGYGLTPSIYDSSSETKWVSNLVKELGQNDVFQKQHEPDLGQLFFFVYGHSSSVELTVEKDKKGGTWQIVESHINSDNL